MNSQTPDSSRWHAQEMARRGDPAADPMDLRVAQALRSAPDVQLPEDFASQVAELARAQGAEGLLEQRLLRGLLVLLALSSAVTVAWYGRGWGAALAGLVSGDSAVPWIGVAITCLLANWAGGLLRQWRGVQGLTTG